jgi:DNA-binding NtrC family response regulator
MAYKKNKDSCILVIDDEMFIGLLLKRILVNQGYKVIAVQSGIEGIELMEKYDVRLVFLDLAMPYVNGAETFRRIRIIYPHMCVVIMTGDPSSAAMKQALNYKPLEVLNKPFGNNDVLRIIERFKNEKSQDE